MAVVPSKTANKPLINIRALHALSNLTAVGFVPTAQEFFAL
jgi:hypothetical protein